MSEDPAATKKTASDGLWVHLCEHPGCKKWGGFGYAAGKGPSNWFCFEHRPATWPPSKQA